MSVVDKIKLQDPSSTPVVYDIGAKAENITLSSL